MAIDRFRGLYDFLSNMSHARIQDIDGRTFNCSEAMFQCNKTIIELERDYFIDISGKTAKKHGGKNGIITLRSDWDRELSVIVMHEVLLHKFSQMIC